MPLPLLAPYMHPDSHGTLGIDFGTSNSAMSWAAPDGLSRLIPLEGDAVSMPTAVFFNSEDHRTHFGRDAVAQYLAGTEGRLMRSLKSLLGSPLIHESTEVNHRPVSFLEIVTTFLAELRERATRTLGSAPRRVVMGRPVHFVAWHTRAAALILDRRHSSSGPLNSRPLSLRCLARLVSLISTAARPTAATI